MQYGAFNPSFVWQQLTQTLYSGFVLLQMYLAHCWNWNRGSSMSSIVEMVRSFRISRLFIITDQRQLQLWQFSQSLMISSHRSMIGKKKTKRIERLHVPPWRRSLKSHLGITIFHQVHMCNLNVCLFFFSDQSWYLNHF